VVEHARQAAAVTAAAQRVLQEQADAVLDEIDCCLGRIDNLSPGARSAVRTAAAGMLAEDGGAGRYSQALSGLLAALTASAEAAAGAPGGTVAAESPQPDPIRAAPARRVVAALRPGVLRGS
jgi:hypothetical protein